MMSKLYFNTLSIVLLLLIASSIYAFEVASPSCGGAHWSESKLPVAYKINTEDFTQLDSATIEVIAATSFDEWSTPECSAFEAIFDGVEIESGSGDQTNSLIFMQTTSSALFGSNVIAITPLAVGSNCEIIEADIFFNAKDFIFVDGEPVLSNEVDAQSIITHEVGHLLGLDHTAVPNATMQPVYPGDLSMRDIEQDDTEGVCFLYPAQAMCISDLECGPGEICMDGSCQEPPPCFADSDCSLGQQCDLATNMCVNNQSDCIVCQSCTTNLECPGGVCAQAPDGRSICIVPCGVNDECPGDSQCFNVGQKFCLNPDALTAGLCPLGYQCMTGIADTDGDGVPDDQDNCVDTINPLQTDNDQDGLGDACDQDDDNDGVDDSADNCPLILNPDQLDFDRDLIGDLCDADDDNDQVLDAEDECPATVIPEMGADALKPNRWALLNTSGLFTQAFPGTGEAVSTEDTNGCSCSQIAEIMNLGVSHLRNGCSTSVLLNWIGR